jgi:AraC-like DNA-binding protein
MGPLTDIFRAVQVRGALQIRLEATSPWGLAYTTPKAGSYLAKFARPRISYAEAASFAMVSRGNCWLTVDGIPETVPLSGGDCFLVAPGKSYSIRDNPRTDVVSFCQAIPTHESGNHVLRYGGGGAPTTIIVSLICFEKASLKPAAQLLPDLILIRAQQARSVGLHTTIQLLAAEMSELTPGSEVVSTRLAEVLFIQALRAHLSNSPKACNPAWLRAIFDPNIGTALREFHDAVADPWTVESLASAAGMSRSAFALRFKQVLGQSPLEYVTEWRMQKAIQLLGDSSRKVADIAQQIGYDSDAAFNKAFKRVVGNTPREYVRQAVSNS